MPFEAAAAAAVAGIFSLLGIIITSVLAYNRSRPKPKPGDDIIAGDLTPTPLSQFSGEQNEFMALVIADNADLRAKMQAVETKFDDRLAVVEKMHERFRGAVRSYLQKLATSWNGPGRMPWPDPHDLAELGDTLPDHLGHPS